MRQCRILGWILLGATLLMLWAMPSMARSDSPQSFDPALFSALRWRLIGPYRAGRVSAVAGIPSQPNVYYMGTPGGGVWKTTDGGRVWNPIFDSVHVASVGSLVISPSNPDIIYVGTGEQMPGQGVFKSTDAGATWTPAGLSDAHFLTSMLIDPGNPGIVLVGSMGNPSPGPWSGVFRTKDGGKTWSRVLSGEAGTGVADMAMDPDNHRVIYAAMWKPNFTPFGPFSGTNKDAAKAIYKSTDEGATWKPLPGTGLPKNDLGRIGVAVAPGNHGKRVFAIVRQGLFRSDDAGQTWSRITTDPRIIGNGYFSKIYSDPRNPDVVYVMQTTAYRSLDGGRTFDGFTGAPSGDDFHLLWINPQDTQHMILGVDQGVTISVDGGKTWTDWLTQPTGQFYHVATDNTFPYHVYAEQQDSGTVAVPNRSDYGEISYRDWYSVGGFEFGNIAPDPLDPDTVFASSWYDTLIRFDRKTGHITYVYLPGMKSAGGNRLSPLVFSHLDPHTLYLGTREILKTSDRGETWQSISPDLTKPASPPANEEERMMARFGSVSSIAPSYKDVSEIWAATTSGTMFLTRDGGKHWDNVAPPGIPAGSYVLMVEASHHDAGTAYAVTGVFRGESSEIYRTHDFGKTWQKITSNLPPAYRINAVREDSMRPGLLYCATDNSVYVSFDDGGHWQSLQLNLPASSMRDLAVQGDDLVVGTFGRGLWILDNLTPLRQLNAEVASSSVHLFQPATAIRVGWDENQDTPLQPETPTASNPPDGAMIDYYLKSPASGEITLTVYDSKGGTVRQFTSNPPPPDHIFRNIPSYWLKPRLPLPTTAGMHRVVWDLRYPYPPVLLYGYFGEKMGYMEYTLMDNAIVGATPWHEPQGLMAVPGEYKVELRVGAQTFEQPLTIRLDPREHATQADLQDQFNLARRSEEMLAFAFDAYNEATKMQAELETTQKGFASGQPKDLAAAVKAAQDLTEAFQNGSKTMAGFGPLNRDITRLYTMLESGDDRPSQSIREATVEACQVFGDTFTQWQKFNASTLPSLNSLLEENKLAAVPEAASASSPSPCAKE